MLNAIESLDTQALSFLISFALAKFRLIAITALRVDDLCYVSYIFLTYYRATACNATHSIAVEILSSVCPSVCRTRVL